MTPAPLPADLRGRVNRFAHAAGAKHAAAVRDRLLAELRRLVAGGAAFDDLKRLMATLERDAAA